ncbi:fibronectin type III-like domain-contianing protein [Nocardioides sp. B-3]|uniref:fibronectin type III-like domain-contianing protein n=1 Tax=Nocardioides sp. B-3 TaxID=2895565 RepID=UPI003FA597F9
MRLAPGASRTVTFRLVRRDLSYWDTAGDEWRMGDGCYRLQLGTSSRSITATTLASSRTACAPSALRLR